MPAEKQITAEELAKGQREISISEFFVKNKHLLGFDNPRKALLTTIKEAVDNSLDACEEARIVPEILVEIKTISEDRFKVIVEDNGPGIVKEQIPNIFAKLLYGSKFHRLRCSRGQQGIGISASSMYGQLTTGKPSIIRSKANPKKKAHYFELNIDTKSNQPKILKDEEIDWPEKIKTAQRNWIGKSEGMLVKFKIDGTEAEIEVFTTRPDTLNAVTFLATSKLYKEGDREKIGKFSGKYAVDPLSGRKLPIWDTNYVAPDYGTGVIMGVPAHDERDMDFAKKYGLDIVKKEPDKSLWKKIEKEGWGKPHINYHLRDWLISRQRYWGPPIPMIYCEKCEKEGKGEREEMPGWYTVSEDELPVKLPFVEDYRPQGTGVSPLATDPEFYQVDCPGCGSEARRETDVSDTFLDSS